MLVQELKKILLRQRVGGVIVLFFVLYGIYIIFFMENAYDVNRKIENNKDLYREYLEEIRGPLTAEKEMYLNEIFQERDRLEVELTAVAERLMEGTFTEEDLYDFYQSNPNIELGYIDVADILESQYTYVAEEPLRRYIINYNGWTNYFENQMGNMIQFIFVVLVFIPMFCHEYDSGMHILQRISAEGYNRIFISKMAAGGLVVSATAILLSVEKLVLHHVRYGLDGAGCPIQSLPRFTDCPWSITIGQGVLFDSALLMGGSLFTAAFIASLSFFTHRILNMTLVALSVILLPYFLISGEVLYTFPFFISLLFPQGFVMGQYSGELLRYAYLSETKFLILACVVLVLSTILILVAHQSKRRRWYL